MSALIWLLLPIHACLLGPGIEALPACQVAWDRDNDSDVDLHDWAQAQESFDWTMASLIVARVDATCSRFQCAWCQWESGLCEVVRWDPLWTKCLTDPSGSVSIRIGNAWIVRGDPACHFLDLNGDRDFDLADLALILQSPSQRVTPRIRSPP